MLLGFLSIVLCSNDLEWGVGCDIILEDSLNLTKYHKKDSANNRWVKSFLTSDACVSSLPSICIYELRGPPVRLELSRSNPSGFQVDCEVEP